MVTSDIGTIYLWFGNCSNLPKSLNEHNFEYHLEHQWQRSFIVIETSKRLDQFNQFQHAWPSTSTGFLCTNPWLTKQIHGSRSWPCPSHDLVITTSCQRRWCTWCRPGFGWSLRRFSPEVEHPTTLINFVSCWGRLATKWLSIGGIAHGAMSESASLEILLAHAQAWCAGFQDIQFNQIWVCRKIVENMMFKSMLITIFQKNIKWAYPILGQLSCNFHPFLMVEKISS